MSAELSAERDEGWCPTIRRDFANLVAVHH